jgi:hypothetical protein
MGPPSLCTMFSVVVAYAGKASRFPIASSEKNPRVSHTAVVENERLGHALALVKAQQDMKYQPQINQQREDRLPEKARTKDLWAADGKSSGGNDGLMGSVEDERNAAFSSVSGINVIARLKPALKRPASAVRSRLWPPLESMIYDE